MYMNYHEIKEDFKLFTENHPDMVLDETDRYLAEFAEKHSLCERTFQQIVDDLIQEGFQTSDKRRMVWGAHHYIPISPEFERVVWGHRMLNTGALQCPKKERLAVE